jgi:nucleotide-binding universal stress UspA family protein
MYRKILVPLDGSPFGERALPLAVTMCLAMKAQLVLVRAATASPAASLDALEGQRQAVAEAETYLAGVAQRLREQKIVTETATPYAAAADGILVSASTRQADLIVMCTHGRSGLGRWVYGSVAEAVLARSAIPVLLVRPTGALPHLTLDLGKGTVLLPLDGSAFAETALPHALEAARALNDRLFLLRVVNPVVGYQPDVVLGQAYAGAIGDRILKEEMAQAESYLGEVSKRLQGEKIAVAQRVCVGWPAESIIEEARGAEAELIVMATHGRTGLAEVVMGSVARDVVHRGVLPLLLVRPQPMQEAT